MSRRARIAALGPGAASLALLVTATACGGDDSASSPSAPPPPPELAILELRPAGGPAWAPGGSCVELGRDPAGTIVASVGPNPSPGTLSNWTLRPRWGCEESRCGYVVIRIDPDSDGGAALVESAASTSISLPLALLPEPAGQHTVRAELHHAVSRTPFETPEGVLAASVEVEITPPGGCGGAVPADAGGGG